MDGEPVIIVFLRCELRVGLEEASEEMIDVLFMV